MNHKEKDLKPKQEVISILENTPGISTRSKTPMEGAKAAREKVGEINILYS